MRKNKIMSYSHIETALSSEDLYHDCNDYLQLRTRKKGAGTAYANQCQFCGEFKGQEVGKKSIPTSPPLENTELREIYEKRVSELFRTENPQIKEVITPISGLKSIQEKAAELENIILDFCAKNNVEPGLLFHIQREWYITNHYQDQWGSEDELKRWFISEFSKWFEIYPEVSGVGYVDREKKSIRIDFLLKAKQELIDHGFTDQFIGIEVKYLNPVSGKGFHGKSSRGVFQALSYWYSGARWSLPDHQNIELATVLMFSNLSFQEERDLVFGSVDSHYKAVWNSYLSIANHANIGELLIKTQNNKVTYWLMNYNGGIYFTMQANRRFTKGKQNVINKKRIGCRKS